MPPKDELVRWTEAVLSLVSAIVTEGSAIQGSKLVDCRGIVDIWSEESALEEVAALKAATGVRAAVAFIFFATTEARLAVVLTAATDARLTEAYEFFETLTGAPELEAASALTVSMRRLLR